MQTQKLIETNPLSKIPTSNLLIVIILTLVVALTVAWYFRNSYKVKKLINWYGGYAVILTIVGLMLKVPISLLVGIYLFGGGVLLLRSNHYFYGK